MGGILGGFQPKDVSQEVACLACHAVDRQPGTPLGEKTVAEFHVDDGVSCVSCHGMVSKSWRAEHPNEDYQWRLKRPADKRSHYGQEDLRDPVTRAKKCLSCHVGSYAEGKVLTHEMYAAGHPPLPGFELTTFSDSQPKHWEYQKKIPYLQGTQPKDKKVLPLAEGDAWELFHYRKSENQQARTVILGAVVTFRQTLQLLHDAAAECDPVNPAAGKKGKDESLDLAQFDCYACHHDIGRSGPRPLRGPVGQPPGRPVMRPIPTELVRIGLSECGNPAAAALLPALDPLLADLNAAIGARPFGDPARVKSAACKLVQWADEALKVLSDAKTEFTLTVAQGLRSRIASRLRAAPDQRPALDYDAARQLVWAVHVINSELGDKPAPAVQGLLDSLAGKMPLEVRPKVKQPITQQMSERMRLLYGFDPASLREPFGAILNALPAAGAGR
jgi:hypothetical protein